MTFSKPSLPVLSIYVPRPGSLSAEFIYNYYVYNESTEIDPSVPSYLRNQSSEQLNVSFTDRAPRIPKYVFLKWKKPFSKDFSSTDGYFPKLPISSYLEKLVTEDSALSSRFVFYSFSNLKDIEDASLDVNSTLANSSQSSQATSIDNYVTNLLTEYQQLDEETQPEKTKKEIAKAIENVEKIADRSSIKLKFDFYDKEGSLIKDFSGIDKLSSQIEPLYSKVNSLVVPDVFTNASLSSKDKQDINSSYYKSNSEPGSYEPKMQIVYLGKEIQDIESFVSKTAVIGYIIEKYELKSEGFSKVRTISIENSSIDSYIDTEVLYGKTYYYSIRSVSRIETFYRQPYGELYKFYNAVYYACSNPTFKKVTCDERIPPPHPVDINFVWDYLRKKLKIVWGMPPNPQRDIKQFQIFRRASINDPFELIKQKCFDFSTKKYQTLESVDGNKPDMSQEELKLVEYEKTPFMAFIDDDFVVDIENLSASKYIYTLASVDAHGMTSNYGAQFEVTFDFFKNKVIKKLISSPGAPRQYPNLYFNVDLFKDVIKTSGQESTKLKVYFNPEYFRIIKSDNKIETMVSTKQKGSFYKIQFINLENQKSDSLKIVIDDPSGLVNPDT